MTDFCQSCKHFFKDVKFRNATVNLCSKSQEFPDIDLDDMEIQDFALHFLNEKDLATAGFYPYPEKIIPKYCIYKFERGIINNEF